MYKTTLSKGLEVYYDGMYGVVRFISDQYITICTQTYKDRMRDVCIVVYPQDYSKITLVKESTK